MAHQLAVSQDQLHLVPAQHGQARFGHGDALGGVGIAAAVVEQVPVERHVPLAPTHGDEQDVDRALPEVPFGAVQTQAQLALPRQQADQEPGQGEVVQCYLTKEVLNPCLIRGRPGGIVEVLGHFAKLHVAALE